MLNFGALKDMTRDYAKKPSKIRTTMRIRKKGSAKVDRLGFLIIGIFFGILASPLLELSNPINQNEIVKSDEFLGSKATNDMMPEFEFYTLLKDAEVIVSEDSDTNINTVKKNEASVDIFMLQVGSFKTNLEAEIFRKKLALLNLNISVEVVTTKNNEVWNRVVIGPFSNLVEMNKAQKVLDGNKIDSLLLKRKKL
ncbi:MAG: hypothetical protein CMK44_06250 [Porticoccus sp.]|jgi:hypothetical protein|nr:hypothetical protein [Porticoccus sp.]|tara:strand:+ start:333 stop:920 length:588 start_codon:yes stop_codon:yes gene_type:complete